MKSIDRNALMIVLGWLYPGIAKKEYLEQSTHFIFNNEEILSYNDEISIACPFEVGVECTVEALTLYKLINRMSDDILDIGMEENKLKLECGTVKAELSTVTASEIFKYVSKLTKEQNQLEWHAMPEDFLDAVRMCAFSASSDKTLGTLTCVWVEGRDVLSTDRSRASWYKMDKEVEKNFYIESAYLLRLMDFDKPVEYCLSDSWCHFQLTNGTVFSTRLTVPGKEKLDIRGVFKEFKHEEEIPLPGALLSAIETVSIAVEKEELLDRRIEIEFNKGMVTCVGSSIKNGTKVIEEIHLSNPLKIKPFTISTYPKSLIEVLDKATHLLVGENQAVFKSREKKGFQHLIGIKRK